MTENKCDVIVTPNQYRCLCMTHQAMAQCTFYVKTSPNNEICAFWKADSCSSTEAREDAEGRKA
jgi:hypothetical protein